jgi:HSP20 family protein
MLADFLFDPFREMLPTADLGRQTFMPSFEVLDTDDRYIFRADLPGVNSSDLDISVTGNRLTIGGKRDQEQEDKNSRYYHRERVYGTFSRSFTLPQGADLENIKAELRDGVLNIVVPKKPEVAPRKVQISSGTQPDVKQARA